MGLHRVPGDFDIEGNKAADKLAKSRAREVFIGPQPIVAIQAFIKI